ncbi:Dynein light chain 1, cytoplasmic [Vitis vinifera]|uniref:Dynein light chain n=1 Tax=Vitis vinifera TaxID=29760 RepID=A0A438E9R2_VITVI|nr:Dynein light chain 1, cytoplasmic [Vitis vinifera]
MLEGKAVVRETDMPEAMQNHCLELAYQALDLHEVCDRQAIAHYIKQYLKERSATSIVSIESGSLRKENQVIPKALFTSRTWPRAMMIIYMLDFRDDGCAFGLRSRKFDEAYGPAWHCVVGVDFGSCITHLCGNFIFFRVETMEFLVFKDGKDLTESKEEAIGVLQGAGKVDS